MAEYTQRFAENRIDLSVVHDLTDEDLKELGVVLGDRRKLLRAIRELGQNETSQSSASTGTAERRQLTVMFCDLVGSTSLSAQLDPEDLREVIGAYHRCCATTVEQHAGFVAKYMGDGVLIYFGYPQAHEHDAERAVQTGLALVEAVSNLAARLQSIAEPGTVVIADGVRRLIGSLFELKDIGEQSLKGIPAPVQIWSVSRASSVESRFEALRAGNAVGLVGRETEFDLLIRQWRAAKRGEGQTVLLGGEAGIGKSRLTSALLERVADESRRRLRYFCSPQHAIVSLHRATGTRRAIVSRRWRLRRSRQVRLIPGSICASFRRHRTPGRDVVAAKRWSIPYPWPYPTAAATEDA